MNTEQSSAVERAVQRLEQEGITGVEVEDIDAAWTF